MLWVNRIVGGALIALSIPLWQVASEYPEMARLFPDFMLAVIALLAAAMIVRSFIPAIAPVGEGEGERSARALARPLTVFVLLLTAVIASTKVGFFPAMIVLVAALVPALGIRRWQPYALGCVALMLFVYGLFVLFLQVPLTEWRPPGW